MYVSDALMQVVDITTFIKNCKGLKSLVLHNLTLQGVQEDFEDCEKAIMGNKALKDVKLEDVKPALDSIDITKLVAVSEQVTACA